MDAQTQFDLSAGLVPTPPKSAPKQPPTFDLSAGLVPSATPSSSQPPLMPLKAATPPVQLQTPEEIIRQQTGIHPFSNPAAQAVAGPARAIWGLVRSPYDLAKAAFSGPKSPEEVAAYGGGGLAGLFLDRMIAQPAEAAGKTASELRGAALNTRDLAKRIDAAADDKTKLAELQKQFPQMTLATQQDARAASARLTHAAIKLYAESVPAAMGAIPLLGAMGQQAGARMAAGDIPGAITESGANALLMGAADSVADTATAPVKALAEHVAPRDVELAGENVPVLAGEAEPKSATGRLQTMLKRTGQKAPKFEEAAEHQQEAVKDVIRNTAAQTSELIGPMQEEPGAAMTDAAEATFNRARPMYQALDESLVQIPDSLKNVSNVVQDAIKKARKLGVTTGADGADFTKIQPNPDGTIQWGGSAISKTTHPERWAELVRDGVIDDSGKTTPLSAYMAIRSQLLKMQRGSSDAALRNAISQEVGSMTDKMDKALEGTPLHENWTEANRLWSKGYALRDVADAINDSVKGTPPSAQAEGLAKVPTKIGAGGLVERLNDLERNGTLERAFTPEEAGNLRKAADILDRAQKTPIGKSETGGFSFFKGLADAARGNLLPLTGAGAGYLAGGLRGAEYGAGIGLIVQEVGLRSLINAMTDTKGVRLLNKLAQAQTASTALKALQGLKLAGMSGSESGQAPQAESGGTPDFDWNALPEWHQ